MGTYQETGQQAKSSTTLNLRLHHQDTDDGEGLVWFLNGWQSY
jgi:hypothetical protein